jgi:hypothetical protein
MKQRCSLPSFTNYKHYGGRGITVCPAWLDFEAFVHDMGDRPPGHTLDRKDNNGPYAPWNCKWSTRSEQMRNTRRAHLLTKDGITMNLSTWAQRLGVTPSAIYARISRYGEEGALT